MKTQKCWVIKLGSALVTNNGLGLDYTAIDFWARQMAMLVENGIEVALVSSGAIACGMQRLGKSTRPQFLNELQACAAVGQMSLAQTYEQAFGRYGLPCAQILLTHDDFSDRKRYLNVRAALTELLRLNVVPIINENDTISTDYIKLGDNDTLAALVVHALSAERLVILTDQDGLFSEDPRQNPKATLIAKATAGDASLEKMAGGAGSAISKGGMLSKILAAKRAANGGASTIIANGKTPQVLLKIANGESVGTFLESQSAPRAARKQWLADQLQIAGSLYLDAGAVTALKSGKSLLPVGVKKIAGDFREGDVLALIAPDGAELGRALVNYDARHTQQILGQATSKIAEILGFITAPELVHRDNLVLF